MSNPYGIFIGVKRNAERYKFSEPRPPVDAVWARSRESRFSLCNAQLPRLSRPPWTMSWPSPALSPILPLPLDIIGLHLAILLRRELLPGEPQDVILLVGIYTSTHIYIYIYIQRERERSLYIYIYR